MPVFAVPQALDLVNRSWSTRWYRHWHAAALRRALIQHLRQRDVSAVVAQCPVSADVALAVRDRLGMSFPIAMVCHFNFSEATEYRERGELADEQRLSRPCSILSARVIGAVDHVIYVSGWARKIVEEQRGIAVRGSSVIWNGIAATVQHPAGPVSRLTSWD